jgi:hypothetical protein
MIRKFPWKENRSKSREVFSFMKEIASCDLPCNGGQDAFREVHYLIKH